MLNTRKYLKIVLKASIKRHNRLEIAFWAQRRASRQPLQLVQKLQKLDCGGFCKGTYHIPATREWHLLGSPGTLQLTIKHVCASWKLQFHCICIDQVLSMALNCFVPVFEFGTNSSRAQVYSPSSSCNLFLSADFVLFCFLEDPELLACHSSSETVGCHLGRKNRGKLAAAVSYSLACSHSPRCYHEKTRPKQLTNLMRCPACTG